RLSRFSIDDGWLIPSLPPAPCPYVLCDNQTGRAVLEYASFYDRYTSPRASRRLRLDLTLDSRERACRLPNLQKRVSGADTPLDFRLWKGLEDDLRQLFERLLPSSV